MDLGSDSLMRLVYLVVLLAALLAFGGGRWLRGRHLRDLLIWGLIIAMVVIAYASWDTLRGALMPGRGVETGTAVELRRAMDGHFHADLEVNGRQVRFLVDTGASDIVLSRADAARVGIDVGGLTFAGRAQTANGVVATAPVRLAVVRFGDAVRRDVPAQVNGGALNVSLLGMAYLGGFSRVEIIGDRMLLHH